jgi:hypothetical protein
VFGMLTGTRGPTARCRSRSIACAKQTVARGEADEDIARLHSIDPTTGVLCTAVVADNAPAEVTQAGRQCATGRAVQHGNHASGRLSAPVASHARSIAPSAEVEKLPQGVGLDRGERYEWCFQQPYLRVDALAGR